MIYLTRARLMLESEKTVHDRATYGDGIPQRVCSQLLSDAPRYSLWRTRHESSMNAVAKGKRRERQILELRSVSLTQIHRTALIHYLREHEISGANRDKTLREFYGVMDARRAAVLEHRNYLMAASSQLCAADLLELVGDTEGLKLVRQYEAMYGQYFGMFCERARATRRNTYLSSALIPEIRADAKRLRMRIMSGDLMPPRRIFARSA